MVQTEVELWQQNLFDVPEDLKGLVQVSFCVLCCFRHVWHFLIAASCPVWALNRSLGDFRKEVEFWQPNLSDVPEDPKGWVRF